MAKQNRQKVQDRRNSKREQSTREDIKPQKFQEERKERVIPLEARTENQRKALAALDSKQCVVLSGSSGSGKTTIAVWHACKRYLKGEIDNIIFTRGPKGFGDTPAVPGSDTEKMMAMVLPMLQNAKKFLGAGILKSNLCTGEFDFLFSEVKGFLVFPLAKIGGMSFDERTIIICDEAQATSIPQMKALATRPENGCQVIICGDTTQSPMRGQKNGLSDLEETLLFDPYPDAEVIKFRPEDNQRKGWSEHITAIYESKGVW
jgi:phosphate starvation-inducible protein PhoH and related proteins